LLRSAGELGYQHPNAWVRNHSWEPSVIQDTVPRIIGTRIAAEPWIHKGIKLAHIPHAISPFQWSNRCAPVQPHSVPPGPHRHVVETGIHKSVRDPPAPPYRPALRENYVMQIPTASTKNGRPSRPHATDGIPIAAIPEVPAHSSPQSASSSSHLTSDVGPAVDTHHQEALACASNLPIEIGSGVVVYSIPAAPLPNVTGYSKRERITPTSEEIAIVSNPIRIMRSQIIDPGLWQMAHHPIRPVLSRWISKSVGAFPT
jgi:hypothetical protein